MNRMIGATAAALALLAALVMVPAAAQAATKKTTIVLDNAEPVSDDPFKRGDMGGTQDYLIAGHLNSVDKCLGGRSLKAVAIRGANVRKLDTDRSSRSGAWAFRATLDPSQDDLKVTVKRSKAGRDTCGGDQIRLGGG